MTSTVVGKLAPAALLGDACCAIEESSIGRDGGCSKGAVRKEEDGDLDEWGVGGCRVGDGGDSGGVGDSGSDGGGKGGGA